jgi:hypothetical protein
MSVSVDTLLTVLARLRPGVQAMRTNAPLWTKLASAALLLVMSGCGATLGSAIHAYDHADYPHAAQQFRKAQKEGLSAEETGRFHLYCGLNHLALGNVRLAIIHLTYARRALDGDATYFALDDRARLMIAWRTLGRMPGQSLTDREQ